MDSIQTPWLLRPVKESDSILIVLWCYTFNNIKKIITNDDRYGDDVYQVRDMAACYHVCERRRNIDYSILMWGQLPLWNFPSIGQRHWFCVFMFTDQCFIGKCVVFVWWDLKHETDHYILLLKWENGALVCRAHCHWLRWRSIALVLRANCKTQDNESYLSNDLHLN